VTAARQLDALTGVRGIAAWLVVLYHICESLAHALPAPVIAVLAKGYLAVDLFFVLSGFVLWLTWGSRFAANGLSAASDFWRKRIARVWPLHAVVLAATVCFALTIEASGRPLPGHYRWGELPLHVVLVQNWGFTSDIGWNDPSWSISTEIAAYLLFPFAAAAVGRLKPRPAVALLFSVVVIAAIDRFYALNGAQLLGADISRLGLVRCLAQFFCGVAVCVVWQHWPGVALLRGAAVTLSAAVVLWAIGLARETLAIPVALAALVLLLAQTSAVRHNPLSSRLAVFLGEISYSTYLAHFLLWTLFKIVFVTDPLAVSLPLAGMFLVLTLAASFILYRVVELPARRWMAGAGAPRLQATAGNPATG